MKRILFLIVCFLVFLPLAKGEVNEVFQAGNEFYKQGIYQKAIEQYTTLIDEGYESFELYFNLGNAHYKAEHIPSALLYYEKAKKLQPGNEDVKFNIRLAGLQTVDKIEPVEKLFLNSLWEKTVNFNSADGWAKKAIVFLFLGVLLLGLYLFTSRLALKKTSFYTGTVLVALSIFTFFLAMSQHHRMSTDTEGIVFTANVTVKSAPDGSSNDLFVIHEGTKVALLQESADWIEISLPNGNSGWIRENDLRKI